MYKIENVRDMIDEYLKCKNNVIYFCKNYVKMDDKENHLCINCEFYERCKN